MGFLKTVVVLSILAMAWLVAYPYFAPVLREIMGGIPHFFEVPWNTPPPSSGFANSFAVIQIETYGDNPHPGGWSFRLRDVKLVAVQNYPGTNDFAMDKADSFSDSCWAKCQLQIYVDGEKVIDTILPDGKSSFSGQAYETLYVVFKVYIPISSGSHEILVRFKGDWQQNYLYLYYQYGWNEHWDEKIITVQV